ncbi:hypothetical protein TrLO_g10035 [Triparma laevis f. longispina]|uniref:Uncharacterized protein n=1 Tax=Triparma laevis f. longispina TaxID=1714387 RepID=A0A9W6ZS00_9STRA|nr:hypothetical protein TrLO_g10035 [Triparma laevis f. longispina]
MSPVSALTLLSLAALGLSSVATASQCGDCWCIPGNGGNDECPDWQPQEEFLPELLADLKAKKTLNPFDDLTCNPYKDEGCVTTPEQDHVDYDGAMCGWKFANCNNSDCGSYEMKTYMSSDEAESDGAYVTHLGACGLCSTAQDLAAYIEQDDMTKEGKKCATKGLIHEHWGKKCYQNLGFTEPCSSIWNYDGIYDGKKCAGICIKNLFADNNGPPPACELNDCLQCDEDEAGPLFKAFAGRTRRRSGLNEEIGRGCDEFAQIDINAAMC